ncbi:hypothetical protein CPB83DRAFT_772071, partial [Crepidotus variabilis]
SDNVQFYLHRKNLEVNAGAFPGAEFETKGEVVQLTEPARTLEIVFRFIYPRRYPDLDGLDFEALLEIAEAVEKYEVFPAMFPTNSELRKFIQEHPIEVLLHALKHDHRNLANEAAPYLAFSNTVFDKLPDHYLLHWVSWQSSAFFVAYVLVKFG